MSDSDLRKVLEQGVVNIYPAKEKLAEALKKDASKLTFYLGVDPTAPFIHLGHAIPLRKLEQLRRVGAKVILLIGNFTATIGDPTDKAATRKVLSSEEVEANAKSYLSLISPVLDLDNAENPVTVKYNNDWWGSMDLKTFLGLAQKVTVQQLLERDMFQVRQKEGKPIYLHEFIYPLLQGYDGVEMKVDGEVGGNDQTFNMLMGRDLSAEFLDKDKFVISVNLLADPSGKKMGKSEGNAVALDAKAPDMFGKIMSWPDAVIESAFELLTDIEADQAKEIVSNLGPRDAKVKLAKEIMKPFHTEEDIAG
ncbi:MAG TPA: tyrosine--tRNA ligase, partial [Flavobacterium sp.]|nr:tyrosine--tRNA ligase [Flavobacterium sp.]